MNTIGEGFRRQYQEILSKAQFVVRPLDNCTEFGSDECILRLLNFKGTGEKRKFSEVQLEYAKYVDMWWDNLWSGGPKRDRKWIDAFVMERNYQVTYADGDITLKRIQGEEAS